MSERQSIRPLSQGRSFASSNVMTPLHTDSQDFLGAPADLQIMRCVRPARVGGESLLADGWALLAGIEREDPALAAALFSTPRQIPFYFGDVLGPTVARKRGRVVFTHSPMPPRDAVGRALGAHLARLPITEIAVRAGETLIVDNHRMLHGRRAFSDPARELERTLAWLTEPLAVSAFSRALDVAPPVYPPIQPQQLDAVRALLAGESPARVAARAGIDEATLYRWRSATYAREFPGRPPLQDICPA